MRLRSLALLAVLAVLAMGFAACAEESSSIAAERADEEYAERMGREHAGDTPVASPAADGGTEVETTSAEVAYADLDGTSVSGYLARPSGSETGPGVLVIQEWWGLNDNIRAMADRFAAAGYIALAVDLYEGEAAEDRDNALRLVRKAMDNAERLEENLTQARAYLAGAGATSIGTVGWCFGGGWSLRTALVLGDGVDAAVMYYGRVVTDSSELAGLTAPLLGHFGALDQGIPVEDVRAFETALGDLGKTATIHVYDEADHAFANPSGTRYQEAAAETAWKRTLAFFAEHLG